MNGIKDWLKGKKTYIVAILGIAGAVMAWATDDMGWIEALKVIGGCLGLSFLRMGVKKLGA